MVDHRLSFLLVLATCLAPAATFGQALVFEVPGASSCIAVGDLDGDGVPDLASGQVFDDTVTLSSGADGSPLGVLTGPSGSAFGRALAALGDVDGDGVPDLAVGAPLTGAGDDEPGAVHIVSLAGGRTLAVVDGGEPTGRLGWSLQRLPDLDGDGLAELAAGVPGKGSLFPGFDGAVLVLRGFDGDVLAVLAPEDLPPDSPTASYGAALGLAGDLDGDDGPELLVGMPAFPLGLVKGEVFAYSTSDLLQPGGAAPVLTLGLGIPEFGRSVAGIDDINGDDVPDVVVGAAFGVGGPTSNGAGLVMSGADGSILLTVSASAPTAGFGMACASPGDLSGDGVPDVVFGGPGNGTPPQLGRVTVASGADGQILYELVGLGGDFGAFGTALSDLGDLTGDGLREFGVTEGQGGFTRVFSAVGVWTDLGFGLAGAAGTPTLAGEGQLLGGDALDVSVADAPASAPGWLFLGFGFVSAPFLGGVMVPEWITVLDLPLTSPAGTLQLGGRWPVDAPSVALYAQVWFLDPTGPQGASATNGVEAKAP